MKTPYTLPHQIDNTPVARLMLCLPLLGSVVLLAVYFMLPGFALDDEARRILSILLPLIAVIDVPAAFLMYRLAKPAKIQLSAVTITVEGDSFLGVKGGVPSATYTPSQFRAIKFDNKRAQSGLVPLSLLKKNGSADLFLGNYPRPVANEFSAFIAASYQLPVEE